MNIRKLILCLAVITAMLSATQAFAGYEQWVVIKITAAGTTFSIENAQVSSGKFFEEFDKDTEFDAGTINKMYIAAAPPVTGGVDETRKSQTSARSDQCAEISKKLRQISHAREMYVQMDQPNVSYTEWLAFVNSKNKPNDGATQTELKLKALEIAKLKTPGDPTKAKVLQDEEKEYRIMRRKLDAMTHLHAAFGTPAGASQDVAVANLVYQISTLELLLKQQQVQTIGGSNRHFHGSR